MNADRRILTPVAASILAGFVVAAATLGGSMSSDAPAVKGDRFKVIGESLCANQEWPNISNECLVWSEGHSDDDAVRFVTLASQDGDAGVTTLTRVREAVETH